MSIVHAGYNLESIWYDPINLFVSERGQSPPYITHDITFAPSIISATVCAQEYYCTAKAGGFATGVQSYQKQGSPENFFLQLLPVIYDTDVVSVTFFHMLMAYQPVISVRLMGYVYFWNLPPVQLPPPPHTSTVNLPLAVDPGAGAGSTHGAPVREKVGLLYDRSGRIMHAHRITALRGGKMVDEKGLEKRTLELAKRRNLSTAKLKFLSVSPKEFGVSGQFRVDPKSGRLVKVLKKG